MLWVRLARCSFAPCHHGSLKSPGVRSNHINLVMGAPTKKTIKHKVLNILHVCERSSLAGLYFNGRGISQYIQHIAVAGSSGHATELLFGIKPVILFGRPILLKQCHIKDDRTVGHIIPSIRWMLNTLNRVSAARSWAKKRGHGEGKQSTSSQWRWKQ